MYLDLSDNQIENVVGQPRTCSLDLSKNPLKKIDDAYFKVPLLLNILNTSYHVNQAKFSELFVKSSEETDGGANFACTGVVPNETPADKAEPTRVLVTSQTFAPKVLCSCRIGFFGTGTECSLCKGGQKSVDGKCCTCPRGTARLNTKNTDQEESICFTCPYNDTCQGFECGKSDCSTGYTGPLCTICKEDFHALFGACLPCDPSWSMRARLAVLVVAGLLKAVASTSTGSG